MLHIRSAIFNLLYMFWTPFIALVLLPIGLIGKGNKLQRVVPVIWAKGVMYLARWVVGIRYEIRGEDYMIKDRAVLYASKHQSAWETVVFWLLVESPVYVLKKELLNIPFFGQYLNYLVHTIAVDRKAGASALKSLISQTKEHLDAERQVLIFPEGTRRFVDDEPDYQPGIAAMYNKLGCAVTPVALNSGVLWGRNAFLKHSGLITIEFLPPIEVGLDRKTFAKTLQDTIEEASNRLAAEARHTLTHKEFS